MKRFEFKCAFPHYYEESPLRELGTIAILQTKRRQEYRKGPVPALGCICSFALQVDTHLEHVRWWQVSCMAVIIDANTGRAPDLAFDNNY